MQQYSWRVVDIVVASVIAVAFGVVFVVWNTAYQVPATALSALAPWATAAVVFVWLIPAVLTPLVIRKPGAGLYAELLAAFLSMLFGSVWGITVMWSGFGQGLGGELGYAVFGYRRWDWRAAMLSGALAGVGSAVVDFVVTYSASGWGFMAPYTLVLAGVAAVGAGLGGWVLVRALARTGVLDPFPSGRAGRAV